MAGCVQPTAFFWSPGRAMPCLNIRYCRDAGVEDNDLGYVGRWGGTTGRPALELLHTLFADDIPAVHTPALRLRAL